MATVVAEHVVERRRAGHFDEVLAAITEIPAAILVGAELVLLFVGVIARYAFDRPITWSDELAQTLFLWLAMLGAVIALRRGTHMRMTAFVTRLSEAWQRRLSAFGLVVVAAFLVLMIGPAKNYVVEQYAILTPALHMHDAYRVASLLVAVVLMLVVVCARLAEESHWIDAIGSVVIIAAIGGVLALAHVPLAANAGGASLVLFFLGMVGVGVLLGVPIAFCFGVSTLSYLVFVSATPLSVVLGQMDQGMSSLELLAVPMFVVLGLMLEMTGIAKVLVDFLARLVGHFRGGLSYVLLGAMFLISGISGSKAADQAAVAPVLFPEMRKRGAHPGELVAQLAAAGAMSETIPPSLALIIIGSVTGVSINALFTGGIIPAALAMIALVVVCFLRSSADVAEPHRASLREIARTFFIAIPGLALPFLIRALVLGGVATATEVSSFGTIYVMLVGLFIYKQFDRRRIYPILIETAALSGAILLIIGAATAMSWALTQAGFAQGLASALAAVPGGRVGFLAVSIVTFLILGSILEGIPSIVLFGPLLFPIATTFGVDQVQYAMIAILAMGVGLFAPPFGVGFYQSCLIGRATSEQALFRVFPYLAGVVVTLILVAAIPWLSLGLLHR